jgi:hypothetical protein
LLSVNAADATVSEPDAAAVFVAVGVDVLLVPPPELLDPHAVSTAATASAGRIDKARLLFTFARLLCPAR